MSDYYGQADTLEQLESELGQVITLQRDPRDLPEPYPCIVGSRTDTKELGSGGWAGSATVEVVLRRSLFTEATLPRLEDVLYLNHRVHRIDSIILSPDQSCVVLACEDVNKDA